MTVRRPTKFIWTRTLGVADAKGWPRVLAVSPSPTDELKLVTPTGVTLDQRAISQLAREIEIEREQRESAA